MKLWDALCWLVLQLHTSCLRIVLGEVVQLEQRLCDLQAKCSPKKEELSKQIPAPSEKFMRSLRAQISLRNENGFWIDDEIGTQSGLDVRDIILTAADEEIATLSPETLAILKPYLSIAELEVIPTWLSFLWCMLGRGAGDVSE